MDTEFRYEIPEWKPEVDYDLDLAGLALDAGAGGAALTLKPEWRRDANLPVSSEASPLALALPSGTGVSLETGQGPGSASTAGLEKYAGPFVNEAFDRAAHMLYLRIDAGLGSLNLDVQ